MRAVGIVLAAGRGERTALPGNKALATLAGATLLEHSVAALAPHVATVVVVAHEDDMARARHLVGQGVAEVVAGAATRHGSELAGLAAAGRHGADVVAVHDAARPLVPARVVVAALAAMADAAGAVPGLPRHVPLARPAGPGPGPATLVPRDAVIGVQTPQAVRLAPLLAAVADRRSGSADAPGGVRDTVEPLLRAMPEEPVVWVEGSVDNIKVTWPGDLAVAAQVLAGGDGARPRLHAGRLDDPELDGAVRVVGVVATTDALRRVDGRRVTGVLERAGLVDLVGTVDAGPGVIDPGLARADLCAAVEAAVRAGAVLTVDAATVDAAGGGP